MLTVEMLLLYAWELNFQMKQQLQLEIVCMFLRVSVMASCELEFDDVQHTFLHNYC